MTYELIIIGGGPAGVSAGVYAGRKLLKTLVIAPEFGGQSIESPDIQNWIGTPHITGAELAKSLNEHLMTYTNETVDVLQEHATNIEKRGDLFVVKTDTKEFETKTVLIATGSHRKKLDIPGAKEFDHRGVTYCASCDGPLYTGQHVVVIGGGNAAFESAAQLLAYATKVTLLNRSETFRADELTVETLRKDPKMEIIINAVPKEIHGEVLVTGLTYTDTTTGQDHTIEAPGIFVEIGALPTTDFAKQVVELDSRGYIPVDPRTQQTKTPGIWAAGDCTDGLYHQNNIASGDAVKALENIYVHLKTK
jgi:thioredoxin-disulfide reductase